MRKIYIWAAALLCFFSCVPLIREEVPSITTTTTTTWQPLPSVSTSELILDIHATASEISFLTRTQYIRLGERLNVLNNRALSTDNLLNIFPSMSDNLFTRFSLNGDNKQVMGLHLARTANNAQYFSTTQMVNAGETFEIEKTKRLTAGCFSKDGTKYILPGILNPANKRILLLFDIQLNEQATNIVRVKIYKRVELPNNLPIGRIISCKQLGLGNNFYIATEQGGFRITQEGIVKTIFKEGIYDFFDYKNKLYAVGLSSDFFVSTNNGLTWQWAGISELKYIETAGDKVFTQPDRGLLYRIADSTLLKTKTIKYNIEFMNQPNTYYDIVFFKDSFFINVGKDIFTLKALTTQ